jgi:hypothetical protein
MCVCMYVSMCAQYITFQCLYAICTAVHCTVFSRRHWNTSLRDQIYVLYVQFSCWWLEIWYLATGVSEQPRWEGYVATKRWQPTTTITLSNFPKLLRFQLSRSLSVKSHMTPCRLVDKVIRIVLPSSAVNLKEVLLPFALIYVTGGVAWMKFGWLWRIIGMELTGPRPKYSETNLSQYKFVHKSHVDFPGATCGLPQRAVETACNMTLLNFPSRCNRFLLPERRFKPNQIVTSPEILWSHMNLVPTGNFQCNVRLPQANLQLHVGESFLRS